MAMPQSESNLGGARFIPPLKRRGFSAPAPDDPKMPPLKFSSLAYDAAQECLEPGTKTLNTFIAVKN